MFIMDETSQSEYLTSEKNTEKDTENREVFTKKTGVEDLSDRKTENQKLFSEERIRPSHTIKAHWWKRK